MSERTVAKELGKNDPVRSQEGVLERAAVKRPKRLFN